MQFIGGWYDYYLRGLLRDYATQIEVGHTPHLMIGPWSHGQADPMLTGLREAMVWFGTHLRGENMAVASALVQPVRLFVMRSDPKQKHDGWQTFDQFPPPATPTAYFLQPHGRLSTENPSETAPPSRYTYDPADPTPAVGGALLAFRGAGMQDNTELVARPDVLVYTSAPLAQPLKIIGRVQMVLYVHSSLPHTDFFGRLCVVTPDGISRNICDGLLRISPATHERIEPLEAGVKCLTIDCAATAFEFAVGERLRVLVASGAHPRWSRNLGTGEGLGVGKKMATAVQTVFHDAIHPSAIQLPVV